MNLIPAQEIKRRGISAVDDALKEGVVHIIKNNEPQYVVLSETQYQSFLELEEEAYAYRLKRSLMDLEADKVHHFKSTEDILKAIKGDDDRV